MDEHLSCRLALSSASRDPLLARHEDEAGRGGCEDLHLGVDGYGAVSVPAKDDVLRQ